MKKYKIDIYEIQKNISFLYYIYGRQPRKFSRWKKNIICTSMIYNKYMTEHVESNKYFYIRGGGIIQKNRNIVK